MSDEENSTTDEEGVDLDELVGRVLDSRGITKERFESLDGIGSKLDNLLSTKTTTKTKVASPAAFDEQGFMERVGDLIDERLGDLGKPKKKPLLAWLGL